MNELMHEHPLRAPRALVVFESMFGNTEQVARAVARGLEAEGVDVDVVEVGQAPETLPRGLALLVVGAPTHAFSLSRPSTRADAVRQGAPASREQVGIREWLAACRHDAAAPGLAVFDTRVTKVRWLPKAAGPKAARIGRASGLDAAGRAASFLVEDIKGPLVDGELEQATTWGRQLGAGCTPGAAHGRVGSR